VPGVDGCKAGWVVVLQELTSGRTAARVSPNISAVLSLVEAPTVIAIDIPIGLLATARVGGRSCEVSARGLLPGRASSVFSSPTRAALDAFRAGGSYRDVCVANRGGDAAAPGISQQAFGILGKISDVDLALTPAAQDRVREVHPELCFAEANAGPPMSHRKTRSAGRLERADLLARLGFAAPLQLLGENLSKGAKPDDLLDACIACWTASRIARGTAIVLPGEDVDARGLKMELWR
jgi:predicted RNase H-like nuclease